MAAVLYKQTYHGDPGQAAGREAAVTVLPNAHHQTIGNLDIRAAGRDMHISTVNVTVQYTPAVQQAAVFLPKARQGTRVQAPMPTEPRRLNLSPFLNFCQIVFNVVFCRGRDHRAGGSINVIALESDRAVDLPPSLLPTHPEVYVRALLKDGLGLPCWEPKPLQANMLPEGVVPGDVGTYTVDRSFKKLFNLWEDESAIQTLAATCSAGMYRALRGRTISEPMLQEGETLREGAHVTSHLTASSSAEPAVLHEFRCYSQSGAVLALTAPALLLTTDDKDAIQSYIVQHVEAIYRHASSIRRLGETESLYVITGCIKSESWAIAAYSEYMQPFDNILQLVRIPPSPQAAPISRPKHQWTKQGTSRARANASDRPGLMSQALFLQGFKVALTPRFRSRITASSLDSDTTSPGTEGGASHEQNETLPPDHDPLPDEEEGAGNGEGTSQAGGSSSGSWSLTLNNDVSASKVALKDDDAHSAIGDEDLLTEFPRPSEIGYHPSDSINAQLLEKTSAEVAICHDDDWRFLFKSCIVESGSDFAPLNSRSEARRLCVKNGVAFVLSKGYDEAQLTQERSGRTNAVIQGRSIDRDNRAERVYFVNEAVYYPESREVASDPRPSQKRAPLGSFDEDSTGQGV